MYVFGLVATASVFRLLGDHSNTGLVALNILLALVGVVGFTAAFRQPKAPKVPQQKFTETGDLE